MANSYPFTVFGDEFKGKRVRSGCFHKIALAPPGFAVGGF
jgi:hypothetical protein